LIKPGPAGRPARWGMHGARRHVPPRGLIHGHRNAVGRVLRWSGPPRRTHGGSRRAASTVAGPVLTVSDPSYSRSACRKFGIYGGASRRPAGRVDRPAFDRANIEFNWRRAHGGPAARPPRNLRARRKSMQLILITARIGRQVDSSPLPASRRDNRPLIVLSVLASCRCSTITHSPPQQKLPSTKLQTGF